MSLSQDMGHNQQINIVKWRMRIIACMIVTLNVWPIKIGIDLIAIEASILEDNGI